MENIHAKTFRLLTEAQLLLNDAAKLLTEQEQHETSRNARLVSGRVAAILVCYTDYYCERSRAPTLDPRD